MSLTTTQMRSTRAVLLGLVLALAGCAGGGGGGDGSVDTCTTDLDCDDTFDCTLDGCRVDNTCRHEPINERCEMGLTCEVGRGCVDSASCATDEDCDDAIACTLDSCGVGGICGQTALDERCSAPTTMCDLTMGCITPPGCSSDGDCDDGVACTNDSCAVDRTCSNTVLHELCDATAMERCHATRGCFVPMPCDTAADCDDSNFCNGAEICDPEFGCSPAEDPRICDDSDDCTVDTCDTAADMCTFTCDSSRSECGCPMTGPSCVGTFRITPTISDNCIGGQVVYDISEVTIMLLGGNLTIIPTTSHFGNMTDMAAPVCPTFAATGGVGGMFPETYTLSGTFSDDDNFTGTFSNNIPPGIGCVWTGSTPVTGVRIP